MRKWASHLDTRVPSGQDAIRIRVMSVTLDRNSGYYEFQRKMKCRRGSSCRQIDGFQCESCQFHFLSFPLLCCVAHPDSLDEWNDKATTNGGPPSTSSCVSHYSYTCALYMHSLPSHNSSSIDFQNSTYHHFKSASARRDHVLFSDSASTRIKELPLSGCSQHFFPGWNPPGRGSG